MPKKEKGGPGITGIKLPIKPEKMNKHPNPISKRSTVCKINKSQKVRLNEG